MFNPKTLHSLTEQFSNLFLNGAHESQDQLKRNVRALLDSTFTKLNVVSRDEFEAQETVLNKTRSKLEVLEKQLSELEKVINKKDA